MAARSFWKNPVPLSLFLITLVCGAMLTFLTEKIFVNNGLGWDGVWYGLYSLEFDKLLSGALKPVDSRVLPSALAHAVLFLFGADLTAKNVIAFFECFNLALLCGTSLLWCAVSYSLGLGDRRTVFGYLVLFCNHAVLKFMFFYPVQTDTTGLFLGMAALFCFLTRRTGWLAVTGVVSAFAWPVVTGFTFLFWLFPLKNVENKTVSGLSFLLPGMGVLVLVAYTYWEAAPTPRMSSFERQNLLPVSLACSLAWGCLTLGSIFSRTYYRKLRSLVRDNKLGWIAPVLVGLIALWVLDTAYLDLLPDSPTVRSLARYALSVFYNSLNRPGEFYVAAVLFLGPGMLILLATPRRAFGACGDFGWGMALCCAFICYQLLNPITRQAVAGFPFLALAAVRSLDEERLTRGFLAVFAALSLVLSKVWMTFLVGVDPAIPGEKNVEFFSRYTGSHGLHMARTWYDVQVWIVLSLLAACVVFMKLPPRSSAPAAPGRSQDY